MLLFSGEAPPRRPLDLTLPDCGTETNELVWFRSYPVYDILLEKQEIGLRRRADDL